MRTFRDDVIATVRAVLKREGLDEKQIEFICDNWDELRITHPDLRGIEIL